MARVASGAVAAHRRVVSRHGLSLKCRSAASDSASREVKRCGGEATTMAAGGRRGGGGQAVDCSAAPRLSIARATAEVAAAARQPTSATVTTSLVLVNI